MEREALKHEFNQLLVQYQSLRRLKNPTADQNRRMDRLYSQMADLYEMIRTGHVDGY